MNTSHLSTRVPLRAVFLTLLVSLGVSAVAAPKTAAVMTDEGSFVARAVKDPDACLLAATRFAADDDATLEQAIRTHPKFYIFHAKDGDLAKWAARIDRVRDADLRAQVALVAEGAEAAKLKTMCDRRDVLFLATGSDGERIAKMFFHRYAPTAQGINYKLLDAYVYKHAAKRTQRLHDAKWGVFNHYLGGGCKTAEAWNRKVNSYNVKLVADQLESCGAKFYFLTIMQGRRWMCAPNATYDRIGGTRPGEATSLRDLPMELAEELGKRGIDLYLYYTGDGPHFDPELGPKFGLTNETRFQEGVTPGFVSKWAAVLEEYAVRYGDRVKGWWIDGCYADDFSYTDELLACYDRAIKKGNPQALVAFNNGVKDYYARYYSKEDFTCGEFNDFYCVPKSRFIDGAQAFALIPLGKGTAQYSAGWALPGCKRSAEHVANYVKLVNAFGGVIAIDVKVHDDGSWDADQLEVLKAVGRATGTLK